MQTLYIDIASHNGLIAYVSDQEIIASHACDTRVGDSELVPIIESMVPEYNQLDRIACIVGPGGFTSLRIAVACANTLAHQLQIPLVGVHLSDVYAARANFNAVETHRRCVSTDIQNGVSTDMNIPNSVWIHSTKKTEVFVRGFGDLTSKWSEPVHMSLDDFLKKVPEGAEWMGELIDEHREAIAQKNLQPVELQPIEDVLPGFLSGLEYGTDQIVPWYGRQG